MLLKLLAMLLVVDMALGGPCETTVAPTGGPCEATVASTENVEKEEAATVASTENVEKEEAAASTEGKPAEATDKAEEGEAAESKDEEPMLAEAGEKAEKVSEVAADVASSGFPQGFMAGFAAEGGLAKDEVQCIKTTLKELMADLSETLKAMEPILLEIQQAPTEAHGKIREIVGKLLEAMELMEVLVKQCLNQEARQKVKQEIKTLVGHLTSFTYMKNSIVAHWKQIEKDIFAAVTLFVNRNYEQAGQVMGQAMQLVLNSTPEATQKYSVEDESMVSRMFGTGANYCSSVLIVLGVALVLFVGLRVVKRRALKSRARTCSKGPGAEGAMIVDVEACTESPRSAALFLAGESDAEIVE